MCVNQRTAHLARDVVAGANVRYTDQGGGLPHHAKILHRSGFTPSRPRYPRQKQRGFLFRRELLGCRAWRESTGGWAVGQDHRSQQEIVASR